MARLAFVGICLATCTHAHVTITKVAEWEVKEVATLNVAENLPGIAGESIVGTTFGPFGKDSVFAIGPMGKGQSAELFKVDESFSWPNEVKQVSRDIKVKANLTGELLIVADGFLFPGKQTGGIHLLSLSDRLSAQKTTISEDKWLWFYHHSEFMDVDMDGVLDVVGARSESIGIRTSSELVWMKNNGDGSWGKTKVLTQGPGVGFNVVDIDGDGKMEVIATEFFKHQQLAIYSCGETSWADCGEKQNVVETIIDASEGPFFQCSWVDLNGDGKKDILATAQQHKVDGQVVPGKVVAFEQPDAWTPGNAKWLKHVLADGYLPQPKQPTGSGAPGVASAFIMDAQTGGKPHVILSGDDGGVVDLLTPATQNSDDWTYSKQTLYTSKTSTSQGVNTIGTVIAADVDGSGRPELFIPSYAENKLLMYTFDVGSHLVV